MSIAKIIKPTNSTKNISSKMPLEDIIFDLIQSCKLEVDDQNWTNAIDKLKSEIFTLESKCKDVQYSLDDKHDTLLTEIQNLSEKINEILSRKPLELSVKLDNSQTVLIGKQHKQLPKLIRTIASGLNVYLVGPAGSGKTHAAEQVAKALKVPFYFTGAIASEYKLTGFIDAQGRIISTEFRKAYQNGGVFLFDEIDASYPQAILAFNAALANNHMDFPDQRVKRNKKFFCIAAANTYGQGADRQYVGRNQMDGASLDRFVFLDWDYDENLELELAGNESWTKFVQNVRKYIDVQKIRHIVSPRASIFGARLIAQGMSRNEVEDMVLWKGMDEIVKQKIMNNVRGG